LLLQQLDDASVSHLGVVVDADYKSEHGLGCAMTLDKVGSSANVWRKATQSKRRV